MREWTSGDLAAARGHIDILLGYEEYEKSQKSSYGRQGGHRNESGEWNLFFSSLAMDEAATNGHLEIVKWLHKNRKEKGNLTALIGASTNGHLNVVRYLVENDYVTGIPGASDRKFFKEAMDGAAINGHLEILRYLHEHAIGTCSIAAMDGAAKHGHLHIVKWLHRNRKEGCSILAIEHAALNGHLEIIQFLRQHYADRGCRYTSTLENAASNGHLEVIKWLHENLPDFIMLYHPAKYAELAASGGHLQVIRYLYETFPKIESDFDCLHGVLDRALECGNLDILNFLLENNHIDKEYKTYFSRISQDRIKDLTVDTVRWVFDNIGTDGSRPIPGHAARYKNIELLRFIRKNYPSLITGSQISPRELQGMASSQQAVDLLEEAFYFFKPEEFVGNIHRILEVFDLRLEVVQWVEEVFEPTKNGKWLLSPKQAPSTYINCTLDVCQYLSERRLCPWLLETAYVRALQNGRLDILKWLEKEGASKRYTAQDVEPVFEHGHLRIAEWLVELGPTARCEGCTQKSLSLAASNGHDDVVRLLSVNYSRTCLVQKELEEAMLVAMTNGYFKTAKLVHSLWFSCGYARQFPTARLVIEALSHGNIEAAEYFYNLHDRRSDDFSPAFFFSRILIGKNRNACMAGLEWFRSRTHWFKMPVNRASRLNFNVHSVNCQRACLRSYPAAKWVLTHYSKHVDAGVWLNSIAEKEDGSLEIARLVYHLRGTHLRMPDREVKDERGMSDEDVDEEFENDEEEYSGDPEDYLDLYNDGLDDESEEEGEESARQFGEYDDFTGNISKEFSEENIWENARLAATHPNSPLMKFFLEQIDPSSPSAKRKLALVVDELCSHEDISSLQYIYNRFPMHARKLLRAVSLNATEKYSLHILRWSLDQHLQKPAHASHCLINAATSGACKTLPMIEGASANRAISDDEQSDVACPMFKSFLTAVEYLEMSLIKWLWENYFAHLPTEILAEAIARARKFKDRQEKSKQLLHCLVEWLQMKTSDQQTLPSSSDKRKRDEHLQGHDSKRERM